MIFALVIFSNPYGDYFLNIYEFNIYLKLITYEKINCDKYITFGYFGTIPEEKENEVFSKLGDILRYEDIFSRKKS